MQIIFRVFKLDLSETSSLDRAGTQFPTLFRNFEIIAQWDVPLQLFDSRMQIIFRVLKLDYFERLDSTEMDCNC